MSASQDQPDRLPDEDTPPKPVYPAHPEKAPAPDYQGLE
jgi:hypothetical protein